MDTIKNTTIPYYGISTLSQNLDTGTALTKQEQILEEATPWTEKLRSVRNITKNKSWLQLLGNQTFDDEGNRYEPEEGFELDAIGINNMLSNRGLSDDIGNFKKVAKARSSSQLEDILNDMEVQSFQQEVANQVLSNKQIAGTMIATELFSPENVGGIGLGVGLSIKSVRGAFALTGSLETSASAARVATGQYEDWNEGLMMVGLSVVPEMAIIHGINKFEAAKIAEKISDVPTRNQMNNEQGKLLLAMPTKDRLEAIARVEAKQRDNKKIFEASAASAKRQEDSVRDTSYIDWYRNQRSVLQQQDEVLTATKEQRDGFNKLLADEEDRYNIIIKKQSNEIEQLRADTIKSIDDEISLSNNREIIRDLNDKKSKINSDFNNELLDIANGNRIPDKDISPMIKTTLNKLKKEAEQRSIDARDSIELEQMIKKIEDNPKYESSSIKSILRNIQKKSKEALELSNKSLRSSKKIANIKSAIKTLESKIANIRSKAKLEGRDLTRGEKSAVTRFKNKLKVEQPKLSSKVDARVKNIEARELNRLTRLIGETFDDTTEAVEIMTKHIKGLSVEEAIEFKQSVDILAKNSPEFKALQTDIANIVKTKAEPKKYSLKNLTGKQKAMIIAASTIGIANASESDNEPIFGVSLSNMVLIISVLAGVKVGLDKFKNGRKFNEALKIKATNAHKSMKFSETNTGTTGTRVKQMKDEIIDNLSAKGLFDIYASLAAHGGAIKRYADEMLFSFEHGKYAAEMEKTHLADASVAKVYTEINNSFNLWLKEQDISTIKNLTQHDALLKRFDSEIVDALETGKGSKATMQVAEVMKREQDIQFDSMISSKVLGAKSAKKIDGYFARMWKSEHIQHLFNMNPKNKIVIADAIKRALLKQGNTNLEAIDENVMSLVSSFEKTYDNRKIQSPNEMFSKIESLLADGVDAATVEAKLAQYADRNNRLKGRLDFDVKELEGIKLLDGNGDEFALEIGNILDRSALSVFTKNTYSNYAHVVMAKRNFPSRTQAMKHIDTITKNNPEAKRDLEDITDMIYGRRINNESQGANNISNSLVDATIVANLGAVAFSTTVEAMMTFALRSPIRGIANAIKVSSGNKNDFLVTIQNKLPIGISGIINKGNVRGFEPTDATAMFNDRSWVGEATHKMKMATVTYSGLAKISDFLQKVNLVTHTELLADFLQTGKGLSKNRLNGYGINDESIALLRNKFEFKNGNVQTPDFDKWTQSEINTYVNIVSRMNEEVTLTRTIGGSGLWQARSNAGKLASSMLGYSTQLLSKQLVRGLKAMDAQTAKTSLLTFMGAYIGLYMRSQVEGKNYTDEQLLTYAMLNIPVAQPYAILMGLSNPAVVQTTKDMTNGFKL